MKRLTEYILGYAHGRPGKTIEDSLNSKTISRGKFECTAIVERLASYEDTGLTPDDCRKLADAKVAGQLVMLPCKTGDKIYDPIEEVLAAENYVADDCIVGRFGFERITLGGVFDDFVAVEDIGKTVFLTREDVVKVLKGSGNGV